jgi:hypothetical protein
LCAFDLYALRICNAVAAAAIPFAAVDCCVGRPLTASAAAAARILW